MQLKELKELKQLLELLPQKEPFRFVSEMIRYEPRSFLEGSFDTSKLPVELRMAMGCFPATCVLEGLAQTAVLFVQLESTPLRADEFPVLGAVQMDVCRDIPWGEAVRYRIEPIRLDTRQAWLSARATGASGTIADGRLGVARTLMPNGR